MIEKIRVGLVGAGFVAPMHVRGWRAAGADVAAVVSEDADIRQRADALGISDVFPTVAAMLDAGAVDVLDVASPPATHHRYVELAVERGLPVMCQKPLADNLEDARAIARTAAAARAPVMVHENWRFRSWYRALHDVLATGELGDVHWARLAMRFAGTVTTARHPEVPYSLDRQPFFADAQPLLVLESVIHQIDIARFLFGEPTDVYARLHRVSPHVRGEDCALVVLGYPQRTVVLERSYAAMGYPDPPVRSEDVAVEGTLGSAFIDRTGRLSVVVDGPAGASCRTAHEPAATAYEDSYAAAIASFVDAVRFHGQVETTPADNLRTLGLVFAAYRSAQTGDVIRGDEAQCFCLA
ncbi:oxidoreductase [Mycolicibacterium agri]|uniref:Oxidoreductase n=1 Tax=Mycolicibacterium agri TaxID=36811 RepID=A0A2A7N325_MYCAG|nr:Gfo/Idh/MocA family oxidoreductase [Mycolicibacterium agri]PEG38209.1 oxidoreductase [Mycolicibacterium agri]GFG49325.1 oxidoreductase [Mycolicibacterium agri]